MVILFGKSISDYSSYKDIMAYISHNKLITFYLSYHHVYFFL